MISSDVGAVLVRRVCGRNEEDAVQTEADQGFGSDFDVRAVNGVEGASENRQFQPGILSTRREGRDAAIRMASGMLNP